MDIATRLSAPAHEVWAFAATGEGVNAELRPLMAMTFPAGLTLADVEPGRGTIAVSWLLALGFVPFDRHALGLAALHPMGFVEESTSWLQRRWRHERIIREEGDGCVVRDIVTVEPRLPFMAPITRSIVAALFRHRHARLARLYGVST